MNTNQETQIAHVHSFTYWPSIMFNRPCNQFVRRGRRHMSVFSIRDSGFGIHVFGLASQMIPAVNTLQPPQIIIMAVSCPFVTP